MINAAWECGNTTHRLASYTQNPLNKTYAISMTMHSYQQPQIKVLEHYNFTKMHVVLKYHVLCGYDAILKQSLSNDDITVSCSFAKRYAKTRPSPPSIQQYA